MNIKVFLIHARNQIRTVWLMARARYVGSYDLQTRDPALVISFAALLLSFVLLGVFDHQNYAREVFDGYVDPSLSRNTYVLVYGFSYLIGTALGYLVLFLLAVPMGYAARFWHGLVALNWWTLLTTLVAVVALLLFQTLDGNDPFISVFIAVLIIGLIIIIWKTINLLTHVLKVKMSRAALLTLIVLVIGVLTTFLVTNAASIKFI